ncbi:MAG: RsbRD N-terminal domain-containing protein [Desulfamplus sp.]|nr:RsbRD N-terminal domain-containing protein [Desulfamplus sp.]
MDINQTLTLNRDAILNRWFEVAVNSYPEDTARIFKKSKNQFDNPVGSATRQSLEDTLNYITDILSSSSANLSNSSDYKNYVTHNSTIDQNKIENALDPVIRIRAVQNFSASQALAFVFELKTIVKSLFDGQKDSFDAIEHIDCIVDLVALAAFNRFMKCRENIFLLKATEAKRRIHTAFERAGLVTELTEEELLGSSKS